MYRLDKSIPNPFPSIRPFRLSEMLLRDPPVVVGYRKCCAHTKRDSGIPFSQSYRIVPCVTYFIGPIAIGCTRWSVFSFLSSSLSFFCYVLVVIKYISSTDKYKMDDPPQLQRSWRLRYSINLQDTPVTTRHRTTSIFLLRENTELEVEDESPFKRNIRFLCTKRGCTPCVVWAVRSGKFDSQITLYATLRASIIRYVSN